MKISVVLTPKPTQMIKNLLECMYDSFESAGVDYEILFSTAGLSKKSIGWFLRWKNTRQIDVGSNSSRAHFWNIAFNQISKDSSLILLLDLDLILFKHSIQKMVALIQSSSGIAAVGSNINAGTYGMQKFELPEDDLLTEVSNFEKEHCNDKFLVPFLEGKCMLIRREVLDRIFSRYGFLVDERLSENFCDDIDLSIRILLEGFRMEVAPTYVWQIDAAESKVSAEDTKLYIEKFRSIWGFSPMYSLISRMDLLQMIPDLKRDGIEILEIGCAAGGTLYTIRTENPSAKLYGVEINPSAAKIASVFAEIENVDIEKFAPDTWHEKFDYIICGDVIEHLVDPWTALRNIRKMLKPNGHLLASIPNVAHIGVIDNLLHGFWHYTDDGILDRTHLRFFTLDSIVKMFNAEKFGKVQIVSKQFYIDEQLLTLAEEFSSRFAVDKINFLTLQYLIDAIK